jgi:hypothetical protein
VLVSSCCEHVWSDGKGLSNPNRYSLPENFKRVTGLNSRSIIIQYPVNFIRNPGFERLIQIIDALTNTLVAITDPVVISAQARNVRSLSLLMKKNITTAQPPEDSHRLTSNITG